MLSGKLPTEAAEAPLLRTLSEAAVPPTPLLLRLFVVEAAACSMLMAC